MSERIGEEFGNYRLTRLLGRGGFAEVYLGEHRYLRTQAAIKILRTRLSHEEQESFYAEARTIAHLQHEHIVRVLEFGLKDNSIPYLVMEYAPQGTLRERFPRGTAIPPQHIIPPFKQVASALYYAHSANLIHRDIKPENMLLGTQNEVLLSDFGIAVMIKSSRQQDVQEVAGTVSYMAPEQLQGRPEIASDQYALGVVVYEWLSGERPFRGSFTEIASQHVLAPPPSLQTRVPGIPAAIDQVVLKALAKSPQQRFASVQDFAGALEAAVLYGQPYNGKQNTSAIFSSTGAITNPARTNQPSTIPNPSAGYAQAIPPVQQPAPRRVISTGMKVVLVALALLLIAGAGLAYALLRPQSGQNNIAQEMQTLYTQSTSGKPMLNDTLSTESMLSWDLVGACAFKGGALHIVKGPSGACETTATDFGNFAYQVEMTIIQSFDGGLIFRNDTLNRSQQARYEFTVTPEGTFGLSVTKIDVPTSTFIDTELIKPQKSTAINTGLNQKNLLTVIARAQNIYLYINRQFVGSVQDSTGLRGAVGMLGDNTPDSKTLDIMFKNAQVWSL